MKNPITLPDDPLWYKDAIIYELRVRAFADSNGDGIGDFRGLTEKLDYLQDLGVTALWLLPFYPSPLKDDGYDISDYTTVHPDIGTLNDFKVFLREAKKRGLRVITELVLNHTSDQHPWFQRARHAKRGSRHRDFYVWSDTPDRYRDTRIIFQDFEASNWTWDPLAQQYFWHRFYANQPDINFDNPQVRKAMFQVLDYWFKMGVDGVRLDAVPYLFEREGTNNENLPETHDLLKDLRRHVDSRFRNRMFLAEANQWPEDAAAYFGDGDECHMNFHFPIMPRMFMSIQMEDRYPIIDILNETPEIPDECQWALFLRNHDELTLEMVTDEERDYMYRMYAHDPQARVNLGIRRRLAPLLNNNRRKIELMNGLLLSLPGTPVLYYGDEIGMGDNIYLGDRNAVRTPMQWSPDRNAGFSRANPQLLYLPVITDPEYHYETVNVETQQRNPQSMLWWMKRLIAMRKRYAAFGRGSIRFLHPSNHKVLAFIREHEEQTILVVANLSRFVQYVELDLSAYQGTTPVELFGLNPFPPIGELPYLLTLGPHSFYWFKLERPQAEEALRPSARLPRLQVDNHWTQLFKEEKPRAALGELLPRYLRARRWFGGKARRVRSAKLDDTPAVGFGDSVAHLAMVRVDYSDGLPDTYMLPLAFATGDRAEQVRAFPPGAAVAELTVRGRNGTEQGVLYDALAEPAFCEALLEAIARRRRFRGSNGTVAAAPTRAFRGLRGPQEKALEPRILSTEQSNTTVIFGDRLIMKVFRRVEPGLNPEVEIGRFLTERGGFEHTPPVAGLIEYRVGRADPASVGILQGFVPNEGDAWRFTVDELMRYYERMQAAEDELAPPPLPDAPLMELAQQEPPPELVERIGMYLESARLLGQRTGEMHIALAADPRDEAFRPEAFSQLYQRSMYQGFRGQASQALELLRAQRKRLPKELQGEAARLLELESVLYARFRTVVGRKMDAMRIRCHGDYHLGQVLYTGRDFTIIDFEGEPARPVSERRIKRTPLRDVAGMIRSFDYAAFTVLYSHFNGERRDHAEFQALEGWGRLWQRWVSAAFLKSYLDTTGTASFLSRRPEELATLVEVHLLEKAMYELAYELNNRPDWVRIPLHGVLQLLDEAQRRG